MWDDYDFQMLLQNDPKGVKMLETASPHRLIPTSVMEGLSQHSKLRTSVGGGG